MGPDASSLPGYLPEMASKKQPDLHSVVLEWAEAAGADPSLHLDRAVAALRLAAEADTYARAEVMAARELDSASWADVGLALGITRQAAHERFRLGPDGFHTRWHRNQTLS